MLTDMLAGATVYIVTGYTDMRKGIDGLSIIVEGKLGQDVYSKSVYLFCGRSCSKIKALVWDGDGFLLLYKRLDNGRYRWPRTEAEAKKLSKKCDKARSSQIFVLNSRPLNGELISL